MSQHILHNFVVFVQRQCLIRGKHVRIHAAGAGAVHLHHILHAAAFLGERQDGGDILILQLFYFDRQLILLQSILEQFLKLLRLLLQAVSITLLFQRAGDICINPAEGKVLILRLQLGNIRRIDVHLHDNCIQLLFLEQPDVLSLLNLVCDVVDDGLIRLFLPVAGLLVLCLALCHPVSLLLIALAVGFLFQVFRILCEIDRIIGLL